MNFLALFGIIGRPLRPNGGAIKPGSPSHRKFMYSRAASRFSMKSSGTRSDHRERAYSRSQFRTIGRGHECVNDARSISPGAIAADCQSAGQLVPFWQIKFNPKYSPWMTVQGASRLREMKLPKSARLVSSQGHR